MLPAAEMNDAAPPNDADGDIDYSGAVKNMAHRYASRVAENTCAAKLAEAEAELSLLELREDGFAQWLSDYKTAADGETCMVDGVETSNCPGRIRVEVTIYYTCPGGTYTVSGTVSGTYKTARRSSSFSATYSAASRGESTSSTCPGFAVQPGATYASGAAAYVRGTPGTTHPAMNLRNTKQRNPDK